MQTKGIVVIPARMESSRLPQKPLLPINKKAMILHVWEKAIEANVGPVIVATDHPDIFSIVTKEGGIAILTSSDHKTGSDRVMEASTLFDPNEKYNIIINLQGDLPYFNPSLLKRLLEPFDQDSQIDISTFIHPFVGRYCQNSLHAVKALFKEIEGKNWGYCKNFSRKPLATPYYHIGIYAYRRNALSKFVTLPSSIRESQESLEQLRALDNAMIIAGVPISGETFISVDTKEDLTYARKHIS